MKELAGVCAAKGIARGFIHILPPLSRAVPNHQVSEESIPQELDRLEVARSSSVKEIEEILIESDLPAEHREIFDAQILLLADPMLFDTAKNRILNGKQNAAGALADTLDDF
ncbi:MAG TPA: phosphoenolpyruvate-utilizing N-terminal domain-containing protein, partial [Leptospiraceae bacterium]|nr:phosphoenolpyruvate-utilizing N-terminal domain-containing protein [Leptospiraceae bacterium]